MEGLQDRVYRFYLDNMDSLTGSDLAYYDSIRQIMDDADWSPEIFDCVGDIAKGMDIPTSLLEEIQDRLDFDLMQHKFENIIMIYIATYQSGNSDN